jgi:hypothetical protein
MNQILLQKFTASYTDLKQQLDFEFLFNDAKMKGEISDDDFAMVLNSNLKIKKFEYEKTQYLKDKIVDLQLGLLKQNKVYSFTNATALIEKLKLSLSGTFNNFALNFKAKGRDLDIQSFLSLLPKHISQKFASYASKGVFTLDLSVKGKPEKPDVKAVFEISNATLGKKSSNVEINHLNLKGYYSNGIAQNLKTSGFYVSTFTANLNKSPIEGNFSVVDFTDPFIDGKLKAQVELSELKEILQLDTFSILEGNANLILRLSCSLEQLKKQDISKTNSGQIAGTLTLKDVKFQLINDLMSFEKINADLYADDNYILVKQLSLSHGKTQLELQGELSNYQTLLNNNSDKALLRAYLNAENFELEDWLPRNQNNQAATHQKDDTYLKNIKLNLKANLTKFKFDQFIANRVSSTIFYDDNVFQFDSLRFNTMDGRANANGAIAIKPQGGFDLICDAKVTKISIDKLFEQLNNFGQNTLTNKNIEGKLSADIQYKSSWNRLNCIIEESILADAKVLIADGALNNFTPMNKLSKFVSVNELSHIKFKELANTISISDKKIYIPQFQINSSAMNLSCSGTHDFNNFIDYHFKVTLNELLSRKRKREVPKNKEFDEIEEDQEGKTTLFISMTGNIENPKIKFDKKELKKYVKDEIKNEKQTVKQLLKEDFGLFKKDKNLKEKTESKNSKNKEFEVEWEEDTKTEKKNEQKVSPSPNPKKAKKEKGSEPKEKNKNTREENSDDFL